MTTNTFTELNLHPKLLQSLEELGYAEPTPIQSTVIPVMMAGHDVIGQAQTGTGKTAAFSLPILQNLTSDRKSVQGLVLAPTRELAIQTATSLYTYGRHLGIRVLAVYGGQPYNVQIRSLKKGIDIVVGTPGRLLDLIEKKLLTISRVSTVVLDEADEMLSMGFIADIKTILDETPSNRQTALFSATLPKGILRLADRYMNNPQSLTVRSKQLTVDSVEQRYYLVNESDKPAALDRLFEVEEISGALIFARTRQSTGELVNELVSRGFQAEVLNGDLSQDARERVLNRFRNNRIKILVATDVAARGLDIDDISHVFNYDLPQESELYVHRIGRTGRAGKPGIAISLLTPKELWNLRKIEAYTKQKILRSKLPSVEDIQGHREAKLVNDLMVWLHRGRCRRELEMIGELAEAGHDPIEIAAAALKLARGEEKQRPIAPIKEVNERHSLKSVRAGKNRNTRNGRNRSNSVHEKGMVRLALNTGAANGIEVNHVLNTLSRHGHVPGRLVGKIRIQKNRTLVDVPERFAVKVLSKTGICRIGKHIIDIAPA